MSRKGEQIGIRRRQQFKTAPCCWCGKETECVHATKTLKCWDCRMKMIKDYQKERKALKIYTNYAEPIFINQQQQQE